MEGITPLSFNPGKNRSYDPGNHCKSVIYRYQLVEIELYSREGIVIVLHFPLRQRRTAEVSLPIRFPDVPLKVPKRLVDFFFRNFDAFGFVACYTLRLAISISTFSLMSFRDFK